MKFKRIRGESLQAFNVRKAIDVLITAGLKRYKVQERSSDQYARAFGLSISDRFSPRSILHLAAEALEDNNWHKEANIMRSWVD